MKSFLEFFNDEYLAIEGIEYLDKRIFTRLLNEDKTLIPSDEVILQQVKMLDSQNDSQDSKQNYINAQQEMQLLRTYKDNPTSQEGKEARAKIIENKMKYIYAIVHRLVRSGRIRGQNFQDAIQQGVLGLIYAIDNCDINKLNKGFTPYASHYISGYASNAFNYKRSKDITSGKSGDVVSMDAEISGDRGQWADKEQTISDKISDNSANSPEELTQTREQQALFQDFMRRLPEKQAKAIQMYWLDQPRKTYEQIGKQLGMTKMGARMLTQRAQNKLKEFAKQYGY